MKLAAATLALSLTVALAPRVALADGPSKEAVDEGRARFSRGIELYRDGDYKAALVEFKRAYEVAPAPRILYNLGQAYFQLQDYAGALDAFERYLADGASKIPADRKKQVTEDVAKLRGRVGTLAITSNVDGAEISVDDVVVGTAPLPKPITVSAGSRKVAATAKGRVPASKVVEVAGGDKASVALALEEVAPPPVVVVTRPDAAPAPQRQPPNMTPVWLGAAATGALAVGAAVLGVLTVTANDTYQAELAKFPGSAADVSSAQSRVHTFSLATDVTAGVAIVALGVTVVLAVTRRSHEPRVASAPLSIAF